MCFVLVFYFLISNTFVKKEYSFFLLCFVFVFFFLKEFRGHLFEKCANGGTTSIYIYKFFQ